jgi:threonine dehydratase
LYQRPGEDRDAVAAALVARTGGTLVHAFANPWVIEGQGSAGIEIQAQLQERGIDGPLHIIACCGGGGLAGGLSLACPDALISIAEPEGWDDVIQSLEAGAILSVADPAYPTPCDALQTPSTAPINFAVLKDRIHSGAVVTPKEVGAAMRLAFERLHLVVEPGGAAALAAVLSGKTAPVGTAVVTLSGGNVDRETYIRMIS